MPQVAYHPIPRYPALLQEQIMRAEYLARAVAVLSARVPLSHPASLWLRGRADEIRSLVDEIVREWSSEGLETSRAREAIAAYVDATHVALHRCYRDASGASCCGPHLEPFEGPPSSAVQPQVVSAVRPPFDSGIQRRTPLAEEGWTEEWADALRRSS
ncbi:MAG TPA: hypothetical protein VGI39_34205 [Polyangiaceae bacterium]|jgi:hypothetical protein